MNVVRAFGIAAALLACTMPIRAQGPRAIVERAVEAMGGEELLATVHDRAWVFKTRGHVVVNDMKLPFAVLARIQSATTHRNDIIIEFNARQLEVVTCIVAGKGWLKGPDGEITDLTEEQQAEWGEVQNRNQVMQVLPLLRDKAYTLTMQEDGVVAEQPTWTIKVSRKGFPDLLLSFEKRSGYLVKLTYTDRNDKLCEDYFSDYREMGQSHDERVVRAAGLDADPQSLLAFLRRLAPDPTKTATVRELIGKLGSDSFAVREQAEKDLIKIGKAAEPLLRQAKKDGDAETARRATTCLTEIEKITKIEKTTNDVTLTAAIRLIGWTHPRGGAEALLGLLPGASEPVAWEAQAVLVTYAGEKPDPALVKALDSPDSVLQAAARAVLGKDGGAYLRQPGRTLFVRGFKDSVHYRKVVDGKTVEEYDTAEFRFVNGVDPKVFEKPAMEK